MIIQTKTGTKITGTLSRDPSLKETKTGKPFLSLSVKAHSTKDAIRQPEQYVCRVLYLERSRQVGRPPAEGRFCRDLWRQS